MCSFVDVVYAGWQLGIAVVDLAILGQEADKTLQEVSLLIRYIERGI